jgi:hypothetical protein
MLVKRVISMMAALLVLVGGFIGIDRAAANEHEDAASVRVVLQDMDVEFGAVGQWEAALYLHSDSEEPDVRLTEWVMAENKEVVFSLPDDLLDGQAAPWDDHVYMRVRTVEGEFPALDLLGAPFALSTQDHQLAFNFSANVVQTETEDTTITVLLNDTDETFGALHDWEAALYLGAEAGQEMEGRFTAWVMVNEQGEAVFTLPDDVLDGEETPWGEEIYFRIRTTADEAPMLDLVIVPFILTEGVSVQTTLDITRGVPIFEAVQNMVFLPLSLYQAQPAQ